VKKANQETKNATQANLFPSFFPLPLLRIPLPFFELDETPILAPNNERGKITKPA